MKKNNVKPAAKNSYYGANDAQCICCSVIKTWTPKVTRWTALFLLNFILCLLKH